MTIVIREPIQDHDAPAGPPHDQIPFIFLGMGNVMTEKTAVVFFETPNVRNTPRRPQNVLLQDVATSKKAIGIVE
jgi:hypothetical protein